MLSYQATQNQDNLMLPVQSNFSLSAHGQPNYHPYCFYPWPSAFPPIDHASMMNWFNYMNYPNYSQASNYTPYLLNNTQLVGCQPSEGPSQDTLIKIEPDIKSNISKTDSRKNTPKTNSKDVSGQGPCLVSNQRQTRKGLSICQQLSKPKSLRPCSLKDDNQYHPTRPQKRIIRKRMHQNQNRNVLPNQINQIISYVQKSNKSIHILHRLFKKYPPPRASYNPTRYYLYQDLLKNKISNYSKEASLKALSLPYDTKCEMWGIQEQRYYNKLGRVLMSYFLGEEAVVGVLTSRRMKKERKQAHLRLRRGLRERMVEIMQ